MKEISTKYSRLTLEDRIRIDIYLTEGFNPYQISIKLSVHRSTITREIARGIDSLGVYRSHYAHKKSLRTVSSRKKGKRRITFHTPLREYIHTKMIEFKWSPHQIANILKKEYPEDTRMHISDEAIYQYIYILPRGELKNHEAR